MLNGTLVMDLRTFDAKDGEPIRSALAAEGWSADQIDGQLHAAHALSASDDGLVMVAGDENGGLIGYISAEFHRWNRLVQIHGLAVGSSAKRQRTGSQLVAKVEAFARARGARGIYVDTPVTNEVARAFYMAVGYVESYRMPRYYSDDLDGVTFSKFFR